MLIIDMPMPKNCCECDLRQDNFDRGEQYCPFTGVECLSIGRQAKCPIKGELVRCGECRRAIPFSVAGNRDALCHCDLFDATMMRKDFCSYGERKEKTDE